MVLEKGSKLVHSLLSMFYTSIVTHSTKFVQLIESKRCSHATRHHLRDNEKLEKITNCILQL